tara:strand:- start:137 stop:760 length:624 start_codon:yes stop_codon:yes gene_type:complete
MNENQAELIGALLGDGYIYRKKRKYIIGFVGNQITDKDYFNHLSKLIKMEWGKDVTPKNSGRGLRIVINSKEICGYLIDDLKLPHGEGKCEKIFIPDLILKDWDLTKSTIRGLIDTDGTVFVAKKPRVDKYPSIEFTTTSLGIANQFREILIDHGFRVAKIWKFDSKNSKRIGYRVPLNGQGNLKKWVKEIGFSNPWKMQRAISYIK